MFFTEQYSLIDFGNGRRLERFNGLLLDRPCPTAERYKKKAPDLWRGADARFVEDAQNQGKGQALGLRGCWKPLTELGRRYFSPIADASLGQTQDSLSGAPWFLPYADRFTFELKGSPFGHLGVFPEQAENWDRIDALCREGKERLGRSIRVLNLFGYTGGSALAAICGGALTTHLDAARNVVAQARRNAELSFQTRSSVVLEDARWIVDDAVKFVKREVKRGNRYEGIVLDPPSYGHGARGEVWRLARDLAPLLERCVELLNDDFNFVMLSCHTPKFEARVLEQMLRAAFQRRFGTLGNVRFMSKPLSLVSERKTVLPSGDLALAILRVR